MLIFRKSFGHPNYSYKDLKLYRMKPPSGDFTCLGSVARKGDEKPLESDYCCVHKSFTSPGQQALIFKKRKDSKDKHPGYLSQVVRSASDNTGVVGGLFLSEEKILESERGVEKDDTLNVFIYKHYYLLKEDGFHVQQSFEMKGAVGKPLQINEVGVQYIYTVSCTVDTKKEKCPDRKDSTLFTEQFSIYRPQLRAGEVSLGDIFVSGSQKPDLGFSVRGLEDGVIS